MNGLYIDGAPAGLEDLAHQVLANYGAYTSFRVESGGVRGLDRHLKRLERQALALFGESPSEARFRALMRQALGGQGEAWLRVNLFSRQITHRDASWAGEPSVMVMVGAPPSPLAGPLRLMVKTYEREEPELKHTATFGLMRARRAARTAGFDDVLFADADGVISEGSLWNIGFLRAHTVLWPQAPMLAGVAQTVIEDGLAGVGMTSQTRRISVNELDGFQAAFICNSATPACAVASIDGRAFDMDAARMDALRAAWASQPRQPI
ncbi:MAG TPA: aminotransferase class IV [Brevundimonas sp.]|nr:aminotransferase class IV [Brevundimonas sp.]